MSDVVEQLLPAGLVAAGGAHQKGPDAKAASPLQTEQQKVRPEQLLRHFARLGVQLDLLQPLLGRRSHGGRGGAAHQPLLAHLQLRQLALDLLAPLPASLFGLGVCDAVHAEVVKPLGLQLALGALDALRRVVGQRLLLDLEVGDLAPDALQLAARGLHRAGRRRLQLGRFLGGKRRAVAQRLAVGDEHIREGQLDRGETVFQTNPNERREDQRADDLSWPRPREDDQAHADRREQLSEQDADRQRQIA